MYYYNYWMNVYNWPGQQVNQSHLPATRKSESRCNNYRRPLPLPWSLWIAHLHDSHWFSRHWRAILGITMHDVGIHSEPTREPREGSDTGSKRENVRLFNTIGTDSGTKFLQPAPQQLWNTRFTSSILPSSGFYLDFIFNVH